MLVRKGLPFDPTKSFVADNGDHVPAGFLDGADAATLAKYGIEVHPDPVYKDSRFYINNPGPNGSVISIPRPTNNILSEIFTIMHAHRDWLTVNGGFGLTVDGVKKWFHSDLLSRTQHLGLKETGKDLLSKGWPADKPFVKPDGSVLMWKTMDGTKVPMTPSLAQAIFDAAVISDSEIFDASSKHESALKALAEVGTVDDIAVYDWTKDHWPERFKK